MSTNFMTTSIPTQNTMRHALSTRFHDSISVTVQLHLHDASAKKHFACSTYLQLNQAKLSLNF